MFHKEIAAEKEFFKWDEVSAWVMEEEKNTSRIPIKGMLENGAAFQADTFFGNRDFKLSFTADGLKSLCYKLGFPVVALEMTAEPELSSRILNDLLSQDSLKAQLENYEFVVDENVNNGSRGRVCGVVSNSYVGYSNRAFLRDIEQIMNKADLFSSENLAFKEAYSINTKLHLRLTSTHICGIVTGKGGCSEDKTEIGLEFCATAWSVTVRSQWVTSCTVWCAQMALSCLWAAIAQGLFIREELKIS